METQTTPIQAYENVTRAVKNANRAGLFELEQSHLLAESLKVLLQTILDAEENKKNKCELLDLSEEDEKQNEYL